MSHISEANKISDQFIFTIISNIRAHKYVKAIIILKACELKYYLTNEIS